jgi:hypothetical protein
LRGSSPVSLGAWDELLEVGARLRDSGVGAGELSGMSAADTLAALQARTDALGAAVRAYWTPSACVSRAATTSAIRAPSSCPR